MATQLDDPTRQQQRVSVAIALFAVVASLAGLVLVTRMVLGDDAVYGLETEARTGEVSLWVERYEWLAHDHGDHDHSGDEAVDPEQERIDEITAQAQVFPMPASMMPGTPNEGFQRLQANLTFLNRGAGGADVEPEQFLLVAEDGSGSWSALRGGTFSRLTLGHDQILNTVVAFDVPEELSGAGMYLEWTTGGETKRFALNGSGHSHG